MYYHGNFCGPGWSDGKYQNSVIGTLDAIDEFDEICKEHDHQYAVGGDLVEADFKFAKQTIGKNMKMTAAGVAVGLQGAVRVLDRIRLPLFPSTNSSMTNPKLRTSTTMTSPNQKPGQSTSLSTVPAAYGYSIRLKEPKITRHGNNRATISGSDFAGNVYASASTFYEPAASVLLNPAYFNSAMLGTLARTFEKFRFKKAHIQYIPSVPTSTSGMIVMTSSRSVKEPFIDGQTTTFLSRALSQGNALATPIWHEAVIDINPDQEWSLVDPLGDQDLDDAVAEEVQVYASATSDTTCGILLLHYEIEFMDALLQYHTTSIPSSVGNGNLITLNDNSAVNAVTDVVVLNGASIPLSQCGVGAIFRCVFQQERSTRPTGPASWATVCRVQANTAATITTVSSAYIDLDLVTGTVFYAVLGAADLVLYNSYDTAVAGGTAGAIIYRTITSAAGTWSFLIHQVRLGSGLIVTTQ